MLQCMKSSIKVLYVNDDPEDFVIFRYEMSQVGFHGMDSFVPKESSQEVLEYLRQKRDHLPDAILVDVRDPMVYGAEILQSIRGSELGQIPVILVSSSIDYLESLKNQHPVLQADGFLVKPVSSRELSDLLVPFYGCA